MKKPIIGLTTSKKDDRASICQDYIYAIEESGGLPFVIPAHFNKNLIEDYIGTIDGLLITGGIDVHPLLYNENPIRECGDFDYEVDILHIELIKTAIKKNIPILGICRGLQLINVTLGGSLYQDIGQIENSNGHMFMRDESQIVHIVNIQKDTILHRLYGDSIYVNSMHHQAIKDLGKNLTVSAYSEDKIVEAIEYKDKPFIMGVQWHPEAMLKKHHSMKKIFDLFIEKTNNQILKNMD